jgi:hypothetical protein
MVVLIGEGVSVIIIIGFVAIGAVGIERVFSSVRAGLIGVTSAKVFVSVAICRDEHALNKIERTRHITILGMYISLPHIYL